ncbi:hypothetical protein B4119_2061 [Parageobacillus caldoxylosilyticus]|uniref:Uncharacterized protein n=1 Tax=Saccharococcus caldoxylosilyticus TaxID=81408 RepID=A0A150LB99_9BACL|nr:hypothetical protein B4119_2061 [Parageobacillus caldoxylosilyticus]
MICGCLAKYDFFATKRAQVVLYDPNEHGVWELSCRYEKHSSVPRFSQ